MSSLLPQNTPDHAYNNIPEATRARPTVPEPTEMTSKTSKTRKRSPDGEETPKVRRFAPQPVETSSKSSRDQGSEKKSAARRFAPEPIETTSKSSRDKKNTSGEEAEEKPAARRFAPQPVETTTKSSKDKSQTGHIKFKPQLVETSYGSNRKSSSRRTSNASSATSEDGTPRKFDPVVVSTARRSRRAGDSNTANYKDYRTEEGHVIHAREHQQHAGWKTPTGSLHDTTTDESRGLTRADLENHPELRRQMSPLDGSAPHRPGLVAPAERTHSFRCPDLDTIESSESERESGPSSMSCSPGQGSPITGSDSSFNEFYKHATRIRESVDENFSGYLLQLEAKKAAQKLLQDQALAAFPNSDFHEPVQHYVNDDQDSSSEMEIEDRPVTWEGFDEEDLMQMQRAAKRRDSTGVVPWEQLEMQRHAEKMEQERKANAATAAKKVEYSPWWKPDVGPANATEMRSMRDRARPPMLGRDLFFPRCPSPEPARFDVTQGSAVLRRQMCYLSAQSEAEVKKAPGGLWASAAPAKTEKDHSMSSANSKSTAKSTTGRGLWGGFCYGAAESVSGGSLLPPIGPTGLMTPAPRSDTGINPFETSFASRNGGLSANIAPPTPPAEASIDMNTLDTLLMTEKSLEEEVARDFPDEFITQVYNYLSLGYPTLARPFDEELAKIAGMTVKELREDDLKAKQSPRGYIRLGKDFEGGGGDGITPVDCKRWQALKGYVKEWARQEKKDDWAKVDAPGGNWATTQRRGSWAI